MTVQTNLPSQAPKEYTVTLSKEEWAVIGVALEGQPFRNVVGVLSNINRQITEARTAAVSAPPRGKLLPKGGVPAPQKPKASAPQPATTKKKA